MKNLIFILAGMLLSLTAQADDISLGMPAYGGSGCPQGTASAVLTPDAKTLSILFDVYQVQAGRGTGTNFMRKNCNIAIPVHIPQGYSVSVLAVDYRGFNHLPSGAHSQFDVEYFFAGSRGPKFTKPFHGPLEADYFIQNNLVASAIVWSACGVDVNLRTNSSLRVQTPSSASPMAYSTVDSEDVRAAIIYRLQWRRC